MEHGTPSPESVGRVVQLRVAPQGPPSTDRLFEQGVRVAIGLAALAAEVVTEAIARTLGHEPFETEGAPSDEDSTLAEGAPLLAGAAIGFAIETTRWWARAATTMLRSGELIFSFATTPSFVRSRLERVASGLRSVDARWRDERSKDEEAAAAVLRLVVPQIVDATLDQIDVNELVRRRIEVDRIVDQVDLDRAIARLDVDAIAARIDVDRVVDRVDLRSVVDRLPLDEIVARIDVDEIVARVDLDRVVGRVDVEAVASKLDLDALVRRLDLVAIAREVIEELDLPDLMRDAMGSMTTETVGGIRMQSMNADRAVARIVDRLLQRRGDRDGGTSADLGSGTVDDAAEDA